MAGLGTYFTGAIYGALYVRYTDFSSIDPVVGDLSDTGPFATRRLGYDFTPQDSVALSVSHYDTSNDVVDGSGTGVQVHYFRRF